MKREGGPAPVQPATTGGVPAAPAAAAEDTLEVMPLGGGAEVGRSCILLRFKGKQVLLDCGVHPAYTGQEGLPFFDMIDDISQIDLLLVTHFHLDHVGSLPYFLEKTSFQGRVFMTHPTKAVYKMLMSDYVRVSNNAMEEQLFTEADLERTMDKIEVVHFHQRVTVNGISFEALNAGHVLGAAQFLIEIAGVRVLYTGDYSREEDRHLMVAEVPSVRPDVLVVEATYGVQMHEPQMQREARFCESVASCVLGGGKCLIPVFALGRAQELLLLLEELWEQVSKEKEATYLSSNMNVKSPHLRSFPIYYASQLARKALTVYSVYITYMNAAIRQTALTRNPFEFKYIRNLAEGSQLLSDPSPCVVMASPGMLQSGFSRQLLEAWCEDSRNAVLLTGYSVEGTMAKHLQTDPTHIDSKSGNRLARRCRIDAVSFSAHCDFLQTSEFVDLVKPNHIVLVHGEKNQMARLQDALLRKYNQAEQAANKRRLALASGAAAATAASGTSGTAGTAPEVALWRPQAIHTPENCVTVEVAFPQQLAEMVPGIGRAVSGVLVRRDFETSLLSANDLPNYTDLSSSAILLRIAIPFSFSFWPQLIAALLSVYSDVVVVKGEAAKTQSEKQDSANVLPSLLVCGRVTLRQSVAIASAASGGSGAAPEAASTEAPEGATLDPRKRRKKAGAQAASVISAASDQECVVLEWSSGVTDDLIADSVAAIVCQCCVAPWAVLQMPRHSHDHHDHSHPEGEEKKTERKLRSEAGVMMTRALANHFGEEAVSAKQQGEEGSWEIAVGDARVSLAEQTGKWQVTPGASEALATQVAAVVERLFARGLLTPIRVNIL